MKFESIAIIISPELNGTNPVPKERYDELRKQYAGNQLAQLEIDMYDPDSWIDSLLTQAIAAGVAGNMERIKAIQLEKRKTVFQRYPDLDPEQLKRLGYIRD